MCLLDPGPLVGPEKEHCNRKQCVRAEEKAFLLSIPSERRWKSLG